MALPSTRVMSFVGSGSGCFAFREVIMLDLHVPFEAIRRYGSLTGHSGPVQCRLNVSVCIA